MHEALPLGLSGEKDGYLYPTEYPLAAKDMYMYEHIPELIKSGITSFKIEGRMRDIEFLRMVVNSYGDAIDRYIADPLGFNREDGADTRIKPEARFHDRLCLWQAGTSVHQSPL